MRTLIAFLRLGRLHFLGGGFLLYALGALVAHVHGASIEVATYALGQGVVTAFQLMTHYANDYFDYDADVANQTPTAWSGGSRVLASGELPRYVALVAALALAAIGATLAAVLVLRVDASVRWTTLATCAAMLALAWAYSAPPFRLCARGLGEVDTALVVTGLVPWLGFHLATPDGAGAHVLLLAIAPLAVLQIAMLLAIEFPDHDSDAATGKRTLVVRVGKDRAAQLYALAVTGAYTLLPLGYLLGLPARVAIAATLPVPIAAWRISRIAEARRPEAFEKLAFFGVFLLVATTVAELAAFWTLR